MSDPILSHNVLGHLVLGATDEDEVNHWATYRNSTSCDPRGLGIDPLREVISRQTISGSRYDVLSCGHRFPASAGCRVADGRRMRRCPLDIDQDDH